MGREMVHAPRLLQGTYVPDKRGSRETSHGRSSVHAPRLLRGTYVPDKRGSRETSHRRSSRELLRLLQSAGADTGGILTQTDHWDTLAYVKPHIEGREENRRDFGNFNELARDTAEALVARLDELASGVNVVVINQQVPQGIHTPFLREAAERLFARGGCPVFVTCGCRGVVVRTGEGFAEIPGVPAPGEINTVGAGDSLLTGIAAALAAGAQPADAASLGNYAAAVAIRKLHQTGTASPDEIRVVAAEAQLLPKELPADPAK